MTARGHRVGMVVMAAAAAACLTCVLRTPRPKGIELDYPDLMRAEGRPDALRLVRQLVEEGRKKDPSTRLIASYGLGAGDDSSFTALAKLAAPEANRTLIQVLRNPGEHVELRSGAAIALLWPGNQAALGPLAERALDRQEDNDLRRAILLRLHRLAVPPPAELRELLYQPFANLDVIAAGSLARLGDAEAPSLLVEGIEEAHEPVFFLEAMEKISKGDVSFPLPKDPFLSPDEKAQICKAFAAWLERHPEVLNTEFERERKAYLESPQRKRELAMNSLEAIVSAKEEDFDFGAAAVWAFAPDKLESTLEKLDRLATGLHTRLVGKTEPEAVLQSLRDTALKKSLSLPEDRRELNLESFLPVVIQWDAGNCVGYSSLYLALAERLGLPLKGVPSPGHFFVRWEDSTNRRNIELTEFGRKVLDAEYVKGWGLNPISDNSIQRGVFLRSLSKREALASVFLNLAVGAENESRHAEALAHADTAIRLNPLLDLAYGSRGHAVFQVDLGGGEAALADFQRALELNPLSAWPLHARAAVLNHLGRLDEALAAIDSALRLDPQDLRVCESKMEILTLLGRSAEARELLEQAVSRDKSAWKFLWTAHWFVEAAANPQGLPDPNAPTAPMGTQQYLAIAEMLLNPHRGSKADPARALIFLDAAVRLSSGIEPERASARSRRRCDMLEARAHFLLGRTAAACGALERAEAFGIVDRDLLELRRDMANLQAR